MSEQRTVKARDAQNETVEIKMGEEDPYFVKCTTVKEHGRGFVILGFRDHPTCGSCHKEFHQNALLPAM